MAAGGRMETATAGRDRGDQLAGTSRHGGAATARQRGRATSAPDALPRRGRGGRSDGDHRCERHRRARR
eukprot:3533133-Pleurochrysis_carterae.AAC.1